VATAAPPSAIAMSTPACITVTTPAWSTATTGLPTALSLRRSTSVSGPIACTSACATWGSVRGGLGSPTSPRRTCFRRTGRKCGKSNSASLLINIDHPDLDHITDLNDFMWVLNEVTRKPADVNQTAAVRADLSEGPKGGYTDDYGPGAVARLQILQARHLGQQRNRISVVPWIGQRIMQTDRDVPKTPEARLPTLGEFVGVDGQLRTQ